MGDLDLTTLRSKYQITARFYDILDLPWELSFYRHMRPHLTKDLSGKVLEAGVGTGRNFFYYPDSVLVKGIDLSPEILIRANRRAKKAKGKIETLQADASQMPKILSGEYDWYFSTFMYCVLPDSRQSAAISEMVRVLKPSGRFRLIEMVYSKNPRLLWRQRLLSGFVEKIYGARFDRHTLKHVQDNPDLEITKTEFLKDDTYLLIEGYKKNI